MSEIAFLWVWTGAAALMVFVGIAALNVYFSHEHKKRDERHKSGT